MTDSRHSRDVVTAIEDRRAVVNDAFEAELPIDDPERLWRASRYLLDAGGKRLRPTILLLTAESLTDTAPGAVSYRTFPTLDTREINILSAAVSVEIIQTFTLIHDDIMDDDRYRRGVETVHEAFDLETAILSGDTLYAKAFEIMLDTGARTDRSLDAIELLAETCTGICEGQTFDIGFEGSAEVTTDEYLEMIEQKTAILYAASAALPGILLEADQATIDELYAFGLDLGRAFQIKDDMLDLTADTETLGKDQGSDLLEGKRTIITIHAREHGVDVDAFARGETDIDEAVAALEAAGSLDFARDLAEEYVTSAQDHLEILPDNEARALLYDLAEYVIERDY